jgi:epoxyqueuosine reductase
VDGVRLHHRRSPQGLWDEARSVIALGMSYAPAADPLALAGSPDRARISVYAQGGDYHDTVKKALKALARWLVAEAERARAWSSRGQGVRRYRAGDGKAAGPTAGLGWQGKHTNLVSREHGSWLFLGAIYTTLELRPGQPGQDHCGSCTPARRPARPRPSPRPTGSMRGAAFPT